MNIVFANIWCFNPRMDFALRALKAHQADVLVLAELPAKRIDFAKKLFSDLPHQQVIAPNSAGSLAVFSRYPISDFEELRFGLLANRPQGRMTIAYKTGFTLFAVHTSAPFTIPNRNRRNRQIEKIAAMVNEESQPVIAIGDFNASHRSPALAPLAKHPRLREGRIGQKISPSWPAGIRFWSIDHIFHSHRFEAQSFEVLPFIYSDHHPISSHLTLAEGSTDSRSRVE